MYANPTSFLFYLRSAFSEVIDNVNARRLLTQGTARSKARTEIELAQLGYNDLIVVRPGMFGQVHREVVRPMEVVLRWVDVFSNRI